MNRIKQLRIENELLQSDLAQMLNVGQGTISNWENGRTEPDQDSLKTIAQRFDVSIDYILGNSDVKKDPTPKEWDSLTDLQKNIIALMGKLSEAQQEEVVRQAEYQLWLQERKKPH